MATNTKKVSTTSIIVSIIILAGAIAIIYSILTNRELDTTVVRTYELPLITASVKSEKKGGYRPIKINISLDGNNSQISKYNSIDSTEIVTNAIEKMGYDEINSQDGLDNIRKNVAAELSMYVDNFNPSNVKIYGIDTGNVLMEGMVIDKKATTRKARTDLLKTLFGN